MYTERDFPSLKLLNFKLNVNCIYGYHILNGTPRNMLELFI
jgi:hypothetical protein